MLHVESAEPDERLSPYIARYVQRESRSAGSELVEPVVARLGTMLEFLFADPYFIPALDGGPPRICPPITVIGPITARRVQLVMQGHIQSLVVLFRPLGLYRLFRTPVSLLAERGTEGHSVFGAHASALYQELGDTPSLPGRKEILDRFFLRQLIRYPALDPRAKALQRLISSAVPLPVRDAARQAGVSVRQLERLSEACAGVSPKMLTRVARFERVIQLKAQFGWSWMRTAHEADYHDQMHMSRDFREFAGGAPGEVIQQIQNEHLIRMF
jgi:AraC-like DNA-binding protein